MVLYVGLEQLVTKAVTTSRKPFGVIAGANRSIREEVPMSGVFQSGTCYIHLSRQPEDDCSQSD